MTTNIGLILENINNVYKRKENIKALIGMLSVEKKVEKLVKPEGMEKPKEKMNYMISIKIPQQINNTWEYDIEKIIQNIHEKNNMDLKIQDYHIIAVQSENKINNIKDLDSYKKVTNDKNNLILYYKNTYVIDKNTSGDKFIGIVVNDPNILIINMFDEKAFPESITSFMIDNYDVNKQAFPESIKSFMIDNYDVNKQYYMIGEMPIFISYNDAYAKFYEGHTKIYNKAISDKTQDYTPFANEYNKKIEELNIQKVDQYKIDISKTLFHEIKNKLNQFYNAFIIFKVNKDKISIKLYHKSKIDGSKYHILSNCINLNIHKYDLNYVITNICVKGDVWESKQKGAIEYKFDKIKGIINKISHVNNVNYTYDITADKNEKKLKDIEDLFKNMNDQYKKELLEFYAKDTLLANIHKFRILFNLCDFNFFTDILDIYTKILITGENKIDVVKTEYDTDDEYKVKILDAYKAYVTKMYIIICKYTDENKVKQMMKNINFDSIKKNNQDLYKELIVGSFLECYEFTEELKKYYTDNKSMQLSILLQNIIARKKYGMPKIPLEFLKKLYKERQDEYDKINKIFNDITGENLANPELLKQKIDAPISTSEIQPKEPLELQIEDTYMTELIGKIKDTNTKTSIGDMIQGFKETEDTNLEFVANKETFNILNYIKMWAKIISSDVGNSTTKDVDKQIINSIFDHIQKKYKFIIKDANQCIINIPTTNELSYDEYRDCANKLINIKTKQQAKQPATQPSQSQPKQPKQQPKQQPKPPAKSQDIQYIAFINSDGTIECKEGVPKKNQKSFGNQINCSNAINNDMVDIFYFENQKIQSIMNDFWKNKRNNIKSISEYADKYKQQLNIYNNAGQSYTDAMNLIKYYENNFKYVINQDKKSGRYFCIIKKKDTIGEYFDTLQQCIEKINILQPKRK